MSGPRGISRAARSIPGRLGGTTAVVIGTVAESERPELPAAPATVSGNAPCGAARDRADPASVRPSGSEVAQAVGVDLGWLVGADDQDVVRTAEVGPPLSVLAMLG